MAKINADIELKIKILLDVGYTGNIDTGEVFTSRNKLSKSIDNYGYQVVSTKIDGKFVSIRAHYFIWYLKYKTIPYKINHINGNKNDNSISNLEEIKNKRLEEIDYSTQIDIGNEKLLKIIKFNLNRVPGFNRIIDKHIKNTIINEAFIKIIRMISENRISNVFEEIKGYIFILCKNEVYINISPKKSTLKINRNYEDLGTLDICQTDYDDENEQFFKNVLDHLLKVNYLWYEIIQMKLESKLLKEIQDELGCPLWNIDTERKKLYKYIRDNVDKFK